jgi:hypothetical protein
MLEGPVEQAGAGALSGDGSARICPICDRPLYAWLTLPGEAAKPTVGLPVDVAAGDENGDPAAAVARVLDRCERCGAGVERGAQRPDLEAELRDLSEPLEDGSLRLATPNRASVQAAIGGEGWAAIDLRPGLLLLTPDSVRRLAERAGFTVESLGCPPVGRNQWWMWQTLVNGLTFHPNFAREVRAGRLRPGNARSRPAFAIDCVVTALAAPLVALVSVPLEALAALIGRGGEVVARLSPSY